MGARRKDADNRRFFDEFEKVRTSRFRAMGVIDPARSEALIPFPGGKVKLLAVKHTRFPSGGGWSYFVCPGCARRAASLWLVDDAPRCCECCNAMNIRHRSEYGFGRNARRQACDRRLDQIIAKLETKTPLWLKPPPASWGGRAQQVYRSRNLTKIMRRRMISLRLDQLASQQAKSGRSQIKTHQPLADARSLIDVKPIWRAPTAEALQQALDHAQVQIINALSSDDPRIRAAAARLMLRTQQARDRGLA